MKYLITGASGQLGREWVLFAETNHLAYEAFSSSELDITDREIVESTLKSINPDVVINCAAYTDVDAAESETGKAFLVNEIGVKNLSEICKSVNSRLVHYSTDYVFPGTKEDKTKYPDGYPEDVETNPVNMYGKSKEAGEKALRNSAPDWILIRVSWLCGRFGSNFFKTMLCLSEEREELQIVDDQTGSPSFTFDVVEKSNQLIELEESGIFHISCRGQISWADFAEEIFQQSARKVKIIRINSDEYEFIAPRPLFSLLSTQKLGKAGLVVMDWKEGVNVLLKQLAAKDR